MNVTINDLFKFTRFMQLFQAIERRTIVPGRATNENDVEHSFHLAMMAWYLNNAGSWGYDTDRLIRYAIVHDIVEVYAGDLPIFHPDRVKKKTKEAAALARIDGELKEFPELVQTIRNYESQIDEESRYVYALDKLMPMIAVYLEGGSTWRELGFKMEPLLANKEELISGSPHIYPLHQELSELIRQKPEMFKHVA